MKRARTRLPFDGDLIAPRHRAVAVKLWRERMRLASTCPCDCPDMGLCAIDAGNCLDAPEVMPAGSMAAGDAWAYLTTIDREDPRQ